MSETITTIDIFRFGPFVLDTHKGTLSQGETELFLRPKAYSLLVHLAQNMGRVVPKSELMDAVWPGIYVTEDSLTQSIREIRKAFGDEQGQVRTVSRRGYMLTGRLEPDAEMASQPIVAVLRFRNDSGDAAREPIVDGFAEDIITGLAQYGSVTLLARNSSFQFPSFEPAAWSDAAARIGADYLVEGSVRWSGNDAQVSVNLIDARTQHQLWGERYQAHDIEMFAVQREIGEQIVNRLANRLDEDSIRRAATKPTHSLAAYELVAQAVAILRGYEHVQPEKALPLLESAVEKDPAYGAAYAYLALCKFMMVRYTTTDRDMLEDILDIATRAAALSPTLAAAPRVTAIVRIYLRQHAEAESDLRLALQLNSSDADTLEQMGYLLAMRGRPQEAIEWIDRAVRLNPIFPPWYHYDRALAQYGLGEYRAAAHTLERVPQRGIWHDARLAACYAQLGDGDACRRQLAKVYAAIPQYPLVWIAREQMPYEHGEDTEHLVEGFTLALEFAKASD
ncbi:MAG: adenylate cyclase [Devosia sp.]|uniref:winged helix-turn-helix domain-containing tetratricopeptide repeat protein n=1 Tax=Devosia sp. TaxID=1871048 RepID=UPI00261177EC|nr:winged helix-turn-helix domain-containing protein [Devosia sp.]MDB5530718.1 adenylate cyclase [Devosia sp.]